MVQKNTGIEISVETPIAMSYEEHIKRVLQLIEEAIKRKTDDRYDCETSLLVMYEDHIIFRDNDVTEILNDFVLKTVVPLQLNIKEIYFAGWSKAVFNAYSLN